MKEIKFNQANVTSHIEHAQCKTSAFLMAQHANREQLSLLIGIIRVLHK